MSDWRSFEINAKKLLEKHFKTFFPLNGSVNIKGKYKKFDFIDPEKKIVGDAKYYSFTATGKRPSAKISTLNEYVWILQKLPSDWKKFIVIGVDRILVEKYVNEFKPWIDGVTIFYSDGKSSLEVIKS